MQFISDFFLIFVPPVIALMMTKMIGNDNGESDDCSDDYGDRDDGGQWP